MKNLVNIGKKSGKTEPEGTIHPDYINVILIILM